MCLCVQAEPHTVSRGTSILICSQKDSNFQPPRFTNQSSSFKGAQPSRGFPGSASGKEPACRCKRLWFDPWVGKIPWRRAWQATPVFLLGKSHKQRNLVGYSPWIARVRQNLSTKPPPPSHISVSLSSTVSASAHRLFLLANLFLIDVLIPRNDIFVTVSAKHRSYGADAI